MGKANKLISKIVGVKKYLFFLSILFFITLWLYRIVKINLIIVNGHLFDFYKLFFAAKELVGKGESEFIASSSYGPPIIYVPYIPLTFLSFKIAEFIITYINLTSYFLVFYLFWRKYYSKTNPYFWFFLGILAFSFPIIYSLGMGNPIGIVLLGIYGSYVLRNRIVSGFFYGLASMMKLFPLIMLPFLFIDKFKKRAKDLNKQSKKFLYAFVAVVALIVLSVPVKVWGSYFNFISGIFGKVATGVDLSAYNQSFSSGITRLGLTVYSFSSSYWIYALLLLSILSFYTFHLLKNKMKFDIQFYLFLIAFTLLIHPFPWQYYYAIFIPFLMVKIFKREFAYLVVFLLLSWDGNRFQIYPFIDKFLLGSQFFGTLILYLLIGLRPISFNSLKLRLKL